MGAHVCPLTHPVRGRPGKCLGTDLGRAVILSRAGEDGCGGGNFTLGLALMLSGRKTSPPEALPRTDRLAALPSGSSRRKFSPPPMFIHPWLAQ